MEEYAKSGDVPSQTLFRGRHYLRIALNTPDFAENEDLPAFAEKYAPDRLRPDDILVLRADAVSLSQGRYFSPGRPTPSKGLIRLCRIGKKVSKSPIYLNPRILEALRLEYGIRIEFAAFAGLFERLFFGRDWFYRIAGSDCRAVFEVIGGQKSGAGDGAIVFPPDNADFLVNRIAETLGCRTLIADLRPERETAHIFAQSENYLDTDELEEILSGAPMKVGLRRVPLCIIRAL